VHNGSLFHSDEKFIYRFAINTKEAMPAAAGAKEESGRSNEVLKAWAEQILPKRDAFIAEARPRISRSWRSFRRVPFGD